MSADIKEALACIDLARRASSDVIDVLLHAEQWAREASEPGNHGHLITARLHVEEAEKRALHCLRLCIEAATELRLSVAALSNLESSNVTSKGEGRN